MWVVPCIWCALRTGSDGGTWKMEWTCAENGCSAKPEKHIQKVLIENVMVKMEKLDAKRQDNTLIVAQPQMHSILSSVEAALSYVPVINWKMFTFESGWIANKFTVTQASVPIHQCTPHRLKWVLDGTSKSTSQCMLRLIAGKCHAVNHIYSSRSNEKFRSFFSLSCRWQRQTNFLLISTRNDAGRAIWRMGVVQSKAQAREFNEKILSVVWMEWNGWVAATTMTRINRYFYEWQDTMWTRASPDGSRIQRVLEGGPFFRKWKFHFLSFIRFRCSPTCFRVMRYAVHYSISTFKLDAQTRRKTLIQQGVIHIHSQPQ